jgi:hypothetical protein
MTGEIRGADAHGVPLEVVFPTPGDVDHEACQAEQERDGGAEKYETDFNNSDVHDCPCKKGESAGRVKLCLLQ